METSVDTATATDLRHAIMRLSRRLRQEGAVSGDLTAGQLVTLATIDKLGPMTLGELAAAERVKPPTITRVVVTLEREGLVSRSTDPDDGRVSLVAVTRAGKQLLTTQRRRRDEWLRARLASLPVDEHDRLLAIAPLLQRLADS